MDKPCPNVMCDKTYKVRKKPFKCEKCDAFIGGKHIPTPDSKKNKTTSKVVKFSCDLYSVHTNQIYRTVCHIAQGI